MRLSAAIRSGALGERPFRLLFGARTISTLGTSFTSVAMAFAVLDVSGSSADLGLVLAARSVPLVLLLVLGGVWADRLPRQRVMQVSNAVSAVSQGAMAVLLITGLADIAELAVLGAIGGAAQAFFFPASTGLVPDVVPETALRSANTILATSLNLSQIIGAALAGLLVAATNPGWAIGIDAVSYLVAAVLLRAIRMQPGPRPVRAGLVRELREGWTEFVARSWVWVIVVQFALVNGLLTGCVDVLGPVVARDHLGGASAWGLVLSTEAVGSVLGGLAVLRLRANRPLLVAELGALAALPLLGLLAVPTGTAWLCLAALAGGAGFGVFGVLWDTALQRHIPRRALSRVSSYDAIGSFALIPVGLAVVGPVAALVGNRAALLGSFGLCVAATLGALAVGSVRATEHRLATGWEVGDEPAVPGTVSVRARP